MYLHTHIMQHFIWKDDGEKLYIGKDTLYMAGEWRRERERKRDREEIKCVYIHLFYFMEFPGSAN